MCAELGRRDVGAYSISYLWRIIVGVINPVLINVESWSNVIVLSATVSAYAYHDPQGCQYWGVNWHMESCQSESVGA